MFWGFDDRQTDGLTVECQSHLNVDLSEMLFSVIVREKEKERCFEVLMTDRRTDLQR